ncbi:hypothetical protein [Paraburkholderia terricola]|uniref:hypothetical protein n=1 Tax=Paraburkholderia terricola TaxID=169427 RepID=UPI003ECD4255
MSIEQAIAYFFAHAALQKERLKCGCATPSPGVFDPLYWTTCRHCGRSLSLQTCIERRGTELTWRRKTIKEIVADARDIAEQERKKK